MTLREQKNDMRWVVGLACGIFTLMLLAGVLGELRANDWKFEHLNLSSLKFFLGTLSGMLTALGWSIGMVASIHANVHNAHPACSIKLRESLKSPQMKVALMGGVIFLVGFSGVLIFIN